MGSLLAAWHLWRWSGRFCGDCSLCSRWGVSLWCTSGQAVVYFHQVRAEAMEGLFSDCVAGVWRIRAPLMETRGPCVARDWKIQTCQRLLQMLNWDWTANSFSRGLQGTPILWRWSPDAELKRFGSDTELMWDFSFSDVLIWTSNPCTFQIFWPQSS